MPDYRGPSDADPVHMSIAIPETPRGIGDRVSQGEERDCHCSLKRQRTQLNFTGEHFWARGYAVSTVGFELEQVRTYIREQEAANGIAGQS